MLMTSNSIWQTHKTDPDNTTLTTWPLCGRVVTPMNAMKRSNLPLWSGSGSMYWLAQLHCTSSIYNNQTTAYETAANVYQTLARKRILRTDFQLLWSHNRPCTVSSQQCQLTSDWQIIQHLQTFPSVTTQQLLQLTDTSHVSIIET